MRYRVVDIELADPLVPVTLDAEESGLGIVARWHDRLVGFRMMPWSGGSITSQQMERIADSAFASALLKTKAREELTDLEGSAQLPAISIAICTKDRAARLKRLLDSLERVLEDAPFDRIEVLVVDNASEGEETRYAAAASPFVDYVYEPRTGLNFARNAAVDRARGEVLCFLDDDVVVDRRWLHGLAEAWRRNPRAGGYTGLVLPFRLDTEAQILFEQNGGFGRGFDRLEYGQELFFNPFFPVGAGMIGAGCNMAFDRKLLLELGGFDEALDTGAPLPGGGDLDIFYRVLRSGRKILYEPQFAVHHEHRETIEQLRRQYWSWGLGTMAFLVKSLRSDRPLRDRQKGFVRWWFLDQLSRLGSAARKLRRREVGFRLAELWGGLRGLFGEYDRSRRRVAAVRAAFR